MTPSEGIHAPQYAEPANFAALLGLTVDADDMGKLARVVDTGEMWSLVEHGARVWKRITEPTAARVVTVYLDTVSGSDGFNGLTQVTPVATMARAAQVVPRDAAVIFHFATAGSYAFTDLSFRPDIAWTLYAPPSTRVSIVASGTAGVGTDSTAIAATGLTTNQHQHMILEMTSGLAAGQRRQIQQNTATSIIPVRRFENQAGTALTVSSGDTYTIYRPGVVLTGLTSIANKRMVWWDVAFDTVSSAPTIADCEVYGSGVEFRGTVFPHFLRCHGSFGMWDNIDAASLSVGSGFTHWSLPSSASRSADVANLFSYVGLSTSLETLAAHRGCGMSAPSITSAVTSSTGGMVLAQCAMSLFGTFGVVSHDQGSYLVGGWYWGNLRSTFNSNCVVTGRAGPSAAVAESTVIKRQFTFERNSLIYCASPVSILPNGLACVNGREGSECVFAGNGTVIGGSVSSDSLGTVDRGCSIVFEGSTTIASNVNATSPLYSSFGAASLWNGARMRVSAAVTWTNAGTRPLFVRSGAVLDLLSGSLSFTGSGGVLVTDGGIVRASGNLTVTNGPLVIDGGYLQVNQASSPPVLSVVTPPGNGITVKNGGNLNQAGGTISSVATAGHGLVADGGNATLLGGASTTLTGTGAGKVGALTYGDGKIRYLAQPTGVSGTAGDLKCGTAAPVPDTDLSVEGASVADASGANRQIMAAYAA
jgi:hypothetical protein